MNGILPELHSIPALHTLPLHNSNASHMGRRRAAERAPQVEDDIEEVVIRNAKVKRGVRITVKAVPVEVPSKATPAQQSPSKKGKQRQVEPDISEGSEGTVPPLYNLEEYQFNDDLMENIPDVEPDRPQAAVCTTYLYHGTENLITCRL
jgi:hypothetical protein